MCSFPMSLSHSFTSKPPFFVKQISDMHVRRLNLKPQHVTISASQSGSVFTVSMKHNIAPPNDTSHTTLNDDIYIRHENELRNVKKILVEKTRENAVEGLRMIDMIERLGIEHHFEEEIEAAIQKQHLLLQTHPRSYGTTETDDLQLSQVALQFRLLRGHAFYVDADVFDEFMDKGRLNQKFWVDIEGLIELFEASHLSMEGENDLDEAREFSHHLLSSSSRFLDHYEANVIANTLKYPIHKSLSRFTPRSFLFTNSQLNKGWTRPLQNLSKIDTQLINSMNLKEIYAVSKWWKGLGLTKDLKFARDEPIKWYMWSMACLRDPCLSEERIELTKPLSLVYIIDDIFDVCGSIDELSLFVDAVNRWDLAATELLPDYMKACFRALYDITNEFANKVQNKHGWNPINTLIKSWVRLCNAFMKEAKWFASGHIPKAEEYLRNGIVSTGVHVPLVHAFFLLGQGITQETVALMDDFPSLISSTATILRLCDDLEGAKDCNNEISENDGSYLKCYMKEHPEVSIEEARDHIRHKISDAWRSLNKQCLDPTKPFPSSFVKICLSASRMVPLMYSYDSCSPSMLEEHVRSLLYRHDGDIQSVPC